MYKKELDQLKKRIQALSNQGLITENQKLLEQLRRALEQAEGLDIVFEKHMEKKNGKYEIHYVIHCEEFSSSIDAVTHDVIVQLF